MRTYSNGEIIDAVNSDDKFARKCKSLLSYHKGEKVFGKDVSCEYVLDMVDGKKKPFFNAFATLEDIGIHLRLKLDGDNFYGNVYDHLVEILKANDSLNPDRDAAEVMMLFFKACSDSTKNKKKPFYLSVKGLYARKRPSN